MVRAHVHIEGSVQGVNFRWYTADRARQRGVTGWVRNRADGSVEAVFEGEREAVAGLVDWCRRGPRHARVTKVDVTWEEPEGLTGFDVEF